MWQVNTNSGSVSFVPEETFVGDAKIQYVVHELEGDRSKEATIFIKVLDINSFLIPTPMPTSMPTSSPTESPLSEIRNKGCRNSADALGLWGSIIYGNTYDFMGKQRDKKRRKTRKITCFTKPNP